MEDSPNIEPVVQPEQGRTLIDDLLEEQQILTAVTRFAQKHQHQEAPLQSRFYRDLIPLAKPGPGEQYAFEVDLDKCSGCKACVTACHSLNGLDENETWRGVGLLHSTNVIKPMQRTVTSACHHCVEPGCLEGCPVLAYEKDDLTGIVRHLDDQCIGCQYCVLKCPYDVPKYSSKRGIVRKCDMCYHRLEAGEAPACVQACPNEAIRITTVDKAAVTRGYQGAEGENNPFLPSSPDPRYTLPSTRYKSAAPLSAGWEAGDLHTIRPEPSHWPLVFMLVLMQCSIGVDTVLGIHRLFGNRLAGSADRNLSILALIVGLAGLVVSVSHLGKPLKAWRAFLGLKHSWLSREILAFGLFAKTSILSTLLALLPERVPTILANITMGAVWVTGMLGLFCSIMVYHDTRRAFWHWKFTAARFAGTSMILGGAASALCLPEWKAPLFGFVTAAALAKLVLDLFFFKQKESKHLTALKRSALLIGGALKPVLIVRYVTLIFAGLLVLTVSLRFPVFELSSLAVALAMLFVSEIAERLIFFRAASEPKMPGGLP